MQNWNLTDSGLLLHTLISPIGSTFTPKQGTDDASRSRAPKGVGLLFYELAGCKECQQRSTILGQCCSLALTETPSVTHISLFVPHKAKCPLPQWPQWTINHITWESSLVSTRTLLSYYYFFFVYIMHFVNSESRLLVTIITNHDESSLLVQVSTNRIRYPTCGSENATWHLDTRHTNTHTHAYTWPTHVVAFVPFKTITSAIHLLQLQHVRTPGFGQPVCARAL